MNYQKDLTLLTVTQFSKVLYSLCLLADELLKRPDLLAVTQSSKVLNRLCLLAEELLKRPGLLTVKQ